MRRAVTPVAKFKSADEHGRHNSQLSVLLTMPGSVTNSDFALQHHPAILALRRSPLISGLIMGIACWLSVMFSTYSRNISPLWLANGVAFMWMLPLPRRRMGWHLVCIAIANVAVGMLYDRSYFTLMTSAGNTAEVALMLFFTYRYYDASTRLFRISALRFTLVTSAVVCAICLPIAPVLISIHNPEWMVTVPNWIFGDVLGMLIVSALVSFWRRRTFSPAFRLSQLDGTLLCILGVLAISFLVFRQTTYPILFLIFPALLFVVFKRGIALAILCFAIHGILATVFTLHGLGPIALLPHNTELRLVLFLQTYLFILMATVYPVGRVLHTQQKLQSLYSLVTDHSGEIISRATMDGVRQYCSPSMTRVLGWTPEEVTKVNAIELYHPEDVPKFQELFQKMRAGQSTPSIITYRAHTKSGGFLWMESHISVFHDPISGKPAGIVASSRDISERVAAEGQLQDAYRSLQRLASTDPLTGLANRRAFDEALEREWRRARRERTPLALLMMDADFFKKYNDALGHPAGDEALRRIARCLQQVVQRPSDVPARYGGEEFVALLPFTEAPGARQVAQRIMDAVAALAMPHPAAGARANFSLSIGVASIFPSLGYSPADLVAAADRALYLAKQNGRSRIEVAAPPLRAPAQQPLEASLSQELRPAGAEHNSNPDAEPATALPLL